MKLRIQRILIGSSIVVASLAMAPVVAGADNPSPQCVITESMTEPTCTVLPVVTSTGPIVSPTNALPFTTTEPTLAPGVQNELAGTTSLPFTGADVEELAVVGVGAVLVGGLLIRRRRRSPA